MAQLRYETRRTQLASRVGEYDAMLNTALTAAMTAFQRRNGCLPGGYDGEEREDVFKLAPAGYRKLAS